MHYDREYYETIQDRSREGRVISEARARLLLERFPLVRKALDIGCGIGDVLKSLEQKGIQVSGVDVSAYAVIETRKKISGEVRRVDVFSQRLPFADKSFDAVTIFDLIEHIPSSEHLFSEVYRVLREKGVVFLTSPNDQGWLRRLLVRIFPDDPTHVAVHNASYWRKKLTDAGFEDVVIRGALLHGFPPLPRFRRVIQHYGLPVLRGPVFFPLMQLCGTLYVLARKPGSKW